MFGHPRLRRGQVSVTPVAKASACRHADAALFEKLLQIPGRSRRGFEVEQDLLVDVLGQFNTDKIRVFERTEHGHASAKAGLDHLVHCLGGADALFHERNRFAPKRVLQAVAYESRHVSFDHDRSLADLREQFVHGLGAGRGRPFGFHDLDQRNHVRRIPPVRSHGAMPRLQLLHYRRDLDDGRVRCKHRIRRREFLDFRKDRLLERELFRRRLEYACGTLCRRAKRIAWFDPVEGLGDFWFARAE